MRPLTLLCAAMTVVLFTMIPMTGFTANEDPLFCSCIPVDDDGTVLSNIETSCVELTSMRGYARWRLRAPQKGEALEAFVIPACTASINGVLVCQGGPEDLAEPLICAGAPSMN